MQLHELQANLAAQNGIVLELEGSSYQELPALPVFGATSSYNFPDGSHARTIVRPWGGFMLAESNGVSHDRSASRRALVAGFPGSLIDHALVLASSEHSLVLTGDVAIRGDVAVGRPGVSVGTLPGYKTPHKVPVYGRIIALRDPNFPPLDLVALRRQMDACASVAETGLLPLNSDSPQSMQVFGWSAEQLDVGSISDSVMLIRCSSGTVFTGSLVRHGPPLYIVSPEPLRIACSLAGPVSIFSLDSITVANPARLTHTVLWSRKSITVKSDSSLCIQTIAPQVLLTPGVRLSYPSLIVSYAPDANTSIQSIHIESSAAIEGSVILVGNDDGIHEPPRLLLDRQALVTGLVYSEGLLTMDATIKGSVISRDFHFEVPPTTYRGWIRTGSIDRPALPDGFLTSPALFQTDRSEILAWL